MSDERIVIVGASLAGAKAAEGRLEDRPVAEDRPQVEEGWEVKQSTPRIGKVRLKGGAPSCRCRPSNTRIGAGR